MLQRFGDLPNCYNAWKPQQKGQDVKLQDGCHELPFFVGNAQIAQSVTHTGGSLLVQSPQAQFPLVRIFKRYGVLHYALSQNC